MAKQNVGAIFEREIKVSGQRIGAFIRKVPTVRYRAVGAELCDFFAIFNGIPILIEAKATRAPITAFSFNLVAPHQVICLNQYEQQGGKSYILINVRLKQSNKVYVLPIGKYLELMRTLDRKSIPLSVLEELPQLPRITGGWNMEILFK